MTDAAPETGVPSRCGATVTPVPEGGTQVTALVVIGTLVVLVAALLTLDWFMAGRTGHRILRSARDGEAANADVGYASIERETARVQQKNGPG